MSITADKAELHRYIDACTDAEMLKRALALFSASAAQRTNAMPAASNGSDVDDTPLSREEFLRRLRS